MSNAENALNPAKSTTTKSERSVTPRKTGIVRKPLNDGQVQGTVTFKAAQTDAKEQPTSATKQSEPAPKPTQMVVGGQVFKNDQVCIPCSYVYDDDKQYGAHDFAPHLTKKKHVDAMVSFRATFGNDMPENMKIILDAMSAASKQLSKRDAYAYLRTLKDMKSSSLSSSDCAVQDRPSTRVSSLGALPSPEASHHDSNDEIDVESCCREQLRIDESAKGKKMYKKSCR